MTTATDVMVARLDACNVALATFTGYRLVMAGGRLWLRHGEGGLPVLVRVRSDGLWLAARRLEYEGGTGEMAICQVIRWHRDQPRRPLRWWEGAVQVGLGSAATVAALAEGGYADPAKVVCVLCGAEPHAWDWWALGGVTGPCCGFARCRKTEGATA